MTPERWQQAQTIFLAALEREAGDRAAFLDKACADDTSLRREVESLLAMHASSGNVLDKTVGVVASKLLAQNGKESLIGQAIGPYKIERQIGCGGMGEVYLARDTRLARPVAIKLLPSSFINDHDRVRRFQQEARAASALNHPNIVTIYEVGQSDRLRFIVSEFVEGRTLREEMKGDGLKLEQALDIVIQTASALAAAHTGGIAHRDIKPENIMVRPDGYVKVVDFGLAKLTERPHQEAQGDGQSDTAETSELSTETGIVMGTVRYMSPEQARGEKVDHRTDIFSLGVVLYETITGRAPFDGLTPSHIIVAILEQEPEPLARYSSEAPQALEAIVTKALTKDRDARYQTAQELLADLKRLKQQMEFKAGPERSKSGDGMIRMSGGPTAVALTKESAARSDEVAAQTTSRARAIVSLIKRHNKAVGLVMAVVLIAAAIFVFSRRAPALTERDTVLIADFVNTTGDAVFDGTLKQALAVQLDQSPFLNIYSDEQVRDALRYMSRSADERVTKDVAREICLRQGLKAMLGGAISNLGNNYVITLEAVNAQTGEAIARQQVEAQSKEQVLSSLGRAATALREKLGESLFSIQKFDTPLEQATTSSLEALKIFSMGKEKSSKGKTFEAISFYKRAVELDSDFAMAYKELSSSYSVARQFEPAAGAAEKAFAKRERATEREKFHIESVYYLSVTGEYDRAIESLLLLKQTYPHDSAARNSLAACYNITEQFEKAMEEASEAIRLNPNYGSPRSNLAAALVGLNRFDDARATFEQMFQEKLDNTSARCGSYVIATVQGHTEVARRELDWLEKNSFEYFAPHFRAWTEAREGRLSQSEELARQAVEKARQRNMKDLAASFAATEMLIKAGCGLCRQSRQEAAQALALSRVGLGRYHFPGLPGVALALALCGEVNEAQKLAGELAKRYPKATMVNLVFLPVIEAAIELQRGNADRAVQLLEAATRYEKAVGWWPTYVRGQAYLRLNRGQEAVAEFQKIVDNPGWGPYPYSVFYPTAHLWLARAARLAGDTAKSRKAYQDFFALWKDADADIPILFEAKKEYESLTGR